MTENQDEIQRLSFPGLAPITYDEDGDPALLDNIPGQQIGTPLKKLLFNPLIKKVNQLVKAANESVQEMRGYLPLTGGTLSGLLEVPDFVENQGPKSVLNMKSSDSRYDARYMPLYGRLGDIVFRIDAKTPDGCLPLDGRSFDKSSNSVLAGLFPSGNLPDLRGYVLRANDNGAGIDPNRVLGSSQDDAIRDITGSFGWSSNGLFTAWDGAFIKYAPNGHSGNDDDLLTGVNDPKFSPQVQFKASLVVPTAPENRMKNFSTNVFIVMG